ncbi:Kelch-like protein 12 [Nymphon striatum]|nr:Kelch-like protein 12 [Nymphon striatum]
MLQIKLPPSTIKDERECLLDFSKSGFLTNFTVKVKCNDNPSFCGEIKVNKEILATGSPYFLNHFLQNPDLNTVEITGFSVERVTKLIDFFYIKEISIENEDLAEILKLAKLFEMDNFLKVLYEKLEHCLNVDNALRIRDIFLFMDNVVSMQSCDNFIKENFESISKTAAFKMIGQRYLLELIKSNDLVVSDEETLFEVVMNWFTEDEIERKNHTKEILYWIRFPLIPVEFLIEIQYHPLIDEDPKLLRMLRDSMYYHQNGKLKQSNHELLRDEHITARNYKTVGSECQPEYFDAEDSISEELSESVVSSLREDFQLLIQHFQASSTQSQEDYCTKLLCIGGSTSDKLLNTIEISSDGGMTWTECGKINPGRENFSANIWKDFIILIGGHGTKYSCSKYNIQKRIHSKLCRLPQTRSLHASSIIGNTVYVAGGEDIEAGNSLISLDLNNSEKLYCFGGQWSNECEIYNSITDQWTTLPSMAYEYFSPQCCYDNENFIYVAGARTYGNYTNTVEQFSINFSQWTTINTTFDLYVDKFTLTFSGGSIYCIGGRDEYYSERSTVKKLNIDKSG